jgi:hypothetical protein
MTVVGPKMSALLYKLAVTTTFILFACTGQTLKHGRFFIPNSAQAQHEAELA